MRVTIAKEAVFRAHPEGNTGVLFVLRILLAVRAEVRGPILGANSNLSCLWDAWEVVFCDDPSRACSIDIKYI